jgi:alpha-amylase/alpha-mannosidase (GH57 family)
VENLKIGFLLHFYQPWWQFPEVLTKIANECYRPILNLVNKASGFCFSANINYSLLELLDRGYVEWNNGRILDSSFCDVICNFRKAVEEKKIELLGSTAYHPIMPLIPSNLQILQMRADAELKKWLWGIEKNCEGIFLPEMAFSGDIIPNLKNFGFRWAVLDDKIFMGQYESFRRYDFVVPYDYAISIEDFKLFFRSNYWSELISFPEKGLESFEEMRDKMSYEIPRWTKNKPAYIILATDAETFGRHRRNFVAKFLEPMLKEWGSSGSGILTPFEKIEDVFPVKNLLKLCDGSWSTTEDDFSNGDPFPLWNSKFNSHHRNLWELVNLALKYWKEPGVGWDCLKMTSSCHWWWISGRPHWKPEFMKFGAKRAMEIIEQFGEKEEKEKGKEIFEKLMALK